MDCIPFDLNVTATSRLLKYAEGADPAVDEPIEVIEESRQLSRDEIKTLVEQGRLRITPEGKAEWVPITPPKEN